jgi:hypothetical protein
MVLTSSDALTQLVIFVGVFLGNMGATLIPYIQAKAKYGEYDIRIIFDNKFLATAASTGIAAFILVSGSFTTFLGQVLAASPPTYLAAFFAALGLGFTFNTIGNMLLPSPTNKEASKELQEKMAFKTLENKGIDVNRLHELMKKDDDGSLPSTEQIIER